MLFEQRFWAPIAAGEVTVTFRRWRRCQVAAGRPNRTPAGIVIVDEVAVLTDESHITDADARAAGYESADHVRGDLRGDTTVPLYRIRFHLAEGPDPRATLAADASLDEASRAELDRRLARLDRASAIGPWTMATLRLIAEQPGVRAGDLAASVGREMAPFKLDVRKLKNLGLTESLAVGYRLSPRGTAYLDRPHLDRP